MRQVHSEGHEDPTQRRTDHLVGRHRPVETDSRVEAGAGAEVEAEAHMTRLVIGDRQPGSHVVAPAAAAPRTTNWTAS